MSNIITDFKKLTVDSINEIKTARKINQNVKSLSEKFIKNKKQDRLKKADNRFKTGKFLSDRIKKKFPSKLFGVPIEEIDENFNDDYVSFIGKYLSNY